MANEVEIKVKSTDKTDYAGIGRDTKARFAKVGDEAGKAGGDAAGKSFASRVKGWFQRSGGESGKGFGSGIKRWFAGEGGGLFSEIGKSGGTFFGSGILGALKTPILGPLLLGAVSAVALTVLPAAGAIAGGALVTGFGAGLAGLGLMFAAKSDVVKAKWRQTTSQLGADMRLLSRPFEGTMVAIADIFEDTVDEFNPYLGRSFEKMAGPIEDFARDAGDALEELLPAIDPVTDAFNATLDALGPAMKSALGDVADGMTDLAHSVEQNPEALADMVRGVGAVTRTGLELVTTLSNVNGKFEDLTGGVSLVDVTMRGLQATMAPLQALFTGVKKGIDAVNALTHDTEASGASMSEAAANTVRLAQAHQGAAGPVKALQVSIQSVTDAATRQALQFSAAIVAMGQWNSRAIAGSNAAIAYQAAIDGATDAVKANGKTLDIGTQKGRANQTALNQIAEAANRQTQAMDEAGASNVSVAATAEKARANFIKIATQMGATKAQAKRMADSMIQIPNVSREAKLTANKRDLERKLAAAKRELGNKDLTRERRAKLNATVASLEAAIRKAKAAIASVPASKTTTIRARYITERIIRTQTTAVTGGHAPATHWAGGPVRGFAGGGQPPSSKEFMVGEYGPEILSMSGGSVARVTPHGDSMRRLQQMGGGAQKLVLEIVAGDSSRYTQFLITELRKAIQIKGGDVQVVLGS